jgi:hypothetical protein
MSDEHVMTYQHRPGLQLVYKPVMKSSRLPLCGEQQKHYPVKTTDIQAEMFGWYKSLIATEIVGHL